MKDKKKYGLLDMLARRFGLEYLSDLQYLPPQKYRIMAQVIEFTIPAEAASLFEWNDALYYLAGREPEKESETARRRLIEALGRNHRK